MNSNRTSSYFPQQPPPATISSVPSSSGGPLQYNEDQETQLNTLANSHPGHQLHHFPQDVDHTSYDYTNNDSLAVPSATSRGKFTEEWDASQRGSSIIDGPSSNMPRSNSFVSNAGEDHLSLPSRHNTLKKKNSLRRNGSLKRSGSRRSMKAGSVRSLALQSTSDPDEAHSAFHCPVPTSGNPTEALSNRFQSWRKILKDLIAYYREIQTHYEHKSKSLLKLANVANNISTPPGFLESGGIDDALQILRTYHKGAILESNKAKEIEEDVILALTGLRSDLHQKIKEIKNLSGDFKNSVEKEMDGTRRAVKTLQDTIGQSDLDPSLTTGKQDPYLLRLAVDRQVERQIDEENYLHQAYLNLENSGRELESIVVGEIQKAYNAYAGILKRESDAAYSAIDELRIGPITMPKDHEWTYFVQKDDQFVDPNIPIRSAEHIHYPGRDHVACQEIRAGLLERKSKYLKSYTAGWYVLSPTHLHEFKSADKGQAPVMSLYLPEQKLGSHSSEGGSSNKFILKGRQTGSMHRGHTWVFRAESHDTMMAWYEDIKVLTERTPQERSEFVRGHVRSLSQSSHRSTSSDGVLDDDDDEPFSADTAVAASTSSRQDLRRPEAGGRFPSDIQVNAQRGLQAPLSPSSVSSGFDNWDRDAAAQPSALPGGMLGTVHLNGYGGTARTPMEQTPSNAALVSQQAKEDGVNPYTNEPLRRSQSLHKDSQAAYLYATGMQRAHTQQAAPTRPEEDVQRTSSIDHDRGLETPGGNSQYGQWMNGNTKSSQVTSSTDNQRQDASDYSVSAKPGNDDINVAAVAAGTSASRGLNNIHTQQSGTSSGTPNPRNQDLFRQTQSAPRPTAGTIRNDSVPTISNLHIPGEYPKGGSTAVDARR
ncbi:Phosphatidylinositol 4,5-bisphosphate-binding protein SLM1 [Colletotrichum fructicola]|uniref:Ph domain protein n=1 Tax=Colletotrichum fructicola (strain Nara gc5) TaxID=1213859 RepID=L2GFD2_COLFN|nr:Phosphatidylinositol 4,5-bisphosphate-binding protein SLM1 [Colletotrichum fructicola]KAF4886784.1 Phosphatidylinositol 4,5-bisphosphate-binding protein SLM1 [Colletotrichum fructicola]KAF4938539.1 Phosphatidylinositol 4,5-bisphosphate-binding protein SLM1 [Colletotrichum fructicola]